MSGDWIKIEHITPDKPEVFIIADQLKIDPDAVVGKLLRVWIWLDQQSRDCHVPGVTVSFIDRKTGVTGFAEALTSVGWLAQVGSGLQFTNIDKHITESAKKRSEALSRKRRERSRKKRDESVTRERERERERELKDNGANARAFRPPTVDEVRAYCTEKGYQLDPEAFCNFYESKGWMVGKTKMKKWKAAAANWEKRDHEENRRHAGQPAHSRRLSAVDEVRAAQRRAEAERQGPLVATVERDD